ncbi:hypothetical protein CWO90_20290 [Bradyrhizobium sp. Leo121]|nr:hypothetical protein CWO90_20290 [Bradyrhizobium sp. Leo121]
MGAFGTHARVLKLVIALKDLIARYGYANAGNEYLADYCHLDARAVERGLADMERAGFIVRKRQRRQRNIYPSLPPDTGRDSRVSFLEDDELPGCDSRSVPGRHSRVIPGHGDRSNPAMAAGYTRSPQPVIRDSKGPAASPPGPIEGEEEGDETPEWIKEPSIPKTRHHACDYMDFDQWPFGD